MQTLLLPRSQGCLHNEGLKSYYAKLPTNLLQRARAPWFPVETATFSENNDIAKPTTLFRSVSLIASNI